MHQTGEKFTAKWRIIFLSEKASPMTKVFGTDLQDTNPPLLFEEEDLRPHFA